MRYGSIGGLEYEVPQKLTHLLQYIGNLWGLVRYDFNGLAVYLSFRTFITHTYYIIFGRLPIGGKLPPPPPSGGATGFTPGMKERVGDRNGCLETGGV